MELPGGAAPSAPLHPASGAAPASTCRFGPPACTLAEVAADAYVVLMQAAAAALLAHQLPPPPPPPPIAASVEWQQQSQQSQQAQASAAVNGAAGGGGGPPGVRAAAGDSRDELVVQGGAGFAEGERAWLLAGHAVGATGAGGATEAAEAAALSRPQGRAEAPQGDTWHMPLAVRQLQRAAASAAREAGAGVPKAAAAAAAGGGGEPAAAEPPSAAAAVAALMAEQKVRPMTAAAEVAARSLLPPPPEEVAAQEAAEAEAARGADVRAAAAEGASHLALGLMRSLEWPLRVRLKMTQPPPAGGAHDAPAAKPAAAAAAAAAEASNGAPKNPPLAADAGWRRMSFSIASRLLTAPASAARLPDCSAGLRSLTARLPGEPEPAWRKRSGRITSLYNDIYNYVISRQMIKRFTDAAQRDPAVKHRIKTICRLAALAAARTELAKPVGSGEWAMGLQLPGVISVEAAVSQAWITPGAVAAGAAAAGGAAAGQGTGGAGANGGPGAVAGDEARTQQQRSRSRPVDTLQVLAAALGRSCPGVAARVQPLWGGAGVGADGSVGGGSGPQQRATEGAGEDMEVDVEAPSGAGGSAAGGREQQLGSQESSQQPQQPQRPGRGRGLSWRGRAELRPPLELCGPGVVLLDDEDAALAAAGVSVTGLCGLCGRLWGLGLAAGACPAMPGTFAYGAALGCCLRCTNLLEGELVT